MSFLAKEYNAVSRLEIGWVKDIDANTMMHMNLCECALGLARQLTDSYYPIGEPWALSVHSRTLTQLNNDDKLITFFCQLYCCDAVITPLVEV